MQRGARAGGGSPQVRLRYAPACAWCPFENFYATSGGKQIMKVSGLIGRGLGPELVFLEMVSILKQPPLLLKPSLCMIPLNRFLYAFL